MVRIVNPAKPDGPEFTKSEILYVYNGLDCNITREVYDEIKPQLNPNTQKIYDFSRALQAPVMDMTLRGVRVDPSARKTLLEYYNKQVRHYREILDQLAIAVWDRPLNPDSPAQLQAFFYGVMGYPAIKSRKGREMKISTDRAALEQLSMLHIYARPIITIILALRDASGSVETLLRGIDDDGRYRAAYNIAGTITGRWSSSKNIFGRGGNLQNVTDKLRRMFIADPKKKLAYIDLEQAESRAVGFICREIFGTDTYLKACGSGDLHTTVCMLNWPELPWTDDPKANRKIADTPFYRELSYRDMAKKLGHGSNYGGSPGVMAMHTKVEKPIIELFQEKYFKSFPELKEYHKWVGSQLKDVGVIVNPFGRERRFFGRPDDHKVINEGIAFTPQSLVADMLNNGLLNVYRLYSEKGMPIELLMQVHDAIVVQYDAEAEDECMMAALACLEAPLAGTDFWIPSDCQVGWNWAKATKAWKPGVYKKDSRVHIPEIGFLFEAKVPTDVRPGPGVRQWKMLEEMSNPRGISGYTRKKAA